MNFKSRLWCNIVFKQVKSLLSGSPLQRTADDICRAADASVAELMPLLQRAAADGMLPHGVTITQVGGY